MRSTPRPPRTPRLLHLTAALFAAPVFWLAPQTAMAQNALGDGRSLDASTRQGAQGFNPAARDFAAEARFRNAIVTGNAPGGRSFRGSVGYTAPDDFRGALGSDSTFGFRRDAFYSGLTSVGGQSLRGVDALRFQLQMSTGGQTSDGVSPIISRSPSLSTQRLDPRMLSLEADQGLGYDPLLSRPGALRATSEFIVGDALSPTILGRQALAEGGETFTVASPLRSVTTQATRDAARSDFPSMISASLPPGEASTRAEGTGVDTRVTGRVDPARFSQQAILDQLRQSREARSGAEAPPEDSLERRLERIRRELEGLPPEDGEPMDAQQLRDLTRDTLQGEAPRVETLTPPAGPERDLFREHMRRGQEMLADDRWFEAEERFTSAVTMRPGDALATAGRAHAQLGAGLYRSASTNLREMFRAHPEMLPVRFDETLLPREERLGDVSHQLRERMAGDSEFSRDAAFLLAYIGYQFRRPADVAEAFTRISRINERLNQRDPVFDAARSVWLTEGD